MGSDSRRVLVSNAVAKKKDAEAEDFEEIVAALLKVDPEGITGQSEKHRKKDESEKD